MRTVHLLYTALLVCPQAISVHAQEGPEAMVEAMVFQLPGRGPYVDVSVALLGPSLVHAPQAQDRQQAEVEVIVIVAQDDRIVDHRKVMVKGPTCEAGATKDFVHMDRFALDPGEYALEVEVKDMHSTGPLWGSKAPLAVRSFTRAPGFSDVLLASSIRPAREGEQARSGSVIDPFIGAYYPKEVGELNFYAELYGMDQAVGQDSLYLLSYQIESHGQRTVFGNFRNAARVKARGVEPIKGRFDIGTLPSGNYLLAIEARDRSGQVVARQERFLQRNNPISYDLNDLASLGMGNTFADRITNADSLAEYIRCLRPVADDLERKIIDDRWKDRDMDLMRRFFYSFWFNRNSMDPASAWQDYFKEVQRVNRMYGTRIKRGYETDRGRVHLRYGAPNTVTDRPNEMDAYPYQIWHYYRAGRYTNRRFVFYLPDLVSNDYELLHSEVPGEINNPHWNAMLHARNTPLNRVDPQPTQSLSGERALEFFNDPR